MTVLGYDLSYCKSKVRFQKSTVQFNHNFLSCVYVGRQLGLYGRKFISRGALRSPQKPKRAFNNHVDKILTILDPLLHQMDKRGHISDPLTHFHVDI